MHIDELVKGPWDTLALYTLTKEQAKALITHPGIRAQQGWMPAGYTFPEHSHSEAQMLLVTRGKLTHVSGKMSYTQGENDLLIVPANLKHHAMVGNEELEFILILKGTN
jgi:quercetin dioxygenase-like cupin family protein